MKNLDLYRIFREVAYAGSFSEAARNLYISQPAVSQAIGQLEEELGRKLFARSRKGAHLTQEGRMLYEHVNAALGMLEAGEEQFERMRLLQEGKLAIGAGDTISEHFLLPYLKLFQEEYPGIALQVINRTSGEELELLKAGKIDVAFVNLPLEDGEIEVSECMQIHDRFVASEKYFLLKDQTLTLSQVAGLHLVMLETLANSRRYVDRFFQDHGVTLKPEIELGAHDLMVEFARMGIGVACVTEEFAGEYLDNGELFALKLEKEIPPRGIGICTLAGRIPSFALETFKNLFNRTRPD
ncbi:LysR family transcriptional regulator [Anaerolentibacter hominis]|uniref:LysR family transcriptional regulator n=1 Tax=Anaerolentibacter hominis TaxID=3079009 RepID=UPI0031B8096A